MSKGTQLVTVRKGKPWQYSEWAASEIVAELAEGKYLSHICRASHLPHMSTVLGWVDRNEHGFKARYFEARRHGAERMFESMMDVAMRTSDDVVVEFDRDGVPFAKINGFAIQRAKLIIDTMRYSLAKLYPSRYGEMSEKLAAADSELELAAERERENDKSFALRPVMDRDTWMKIHGLDKVATTVAVETRQER